MPRITLVLALVSLAFLVALVPTANAAPPCVATPLEDKVDCVQDLVAHRCVYGYSRDCIVYNPCNPTYCDPAWP